MRWRAAAPSNRSLVRKRTQCYRSRVGTDIHWFVERRANASSLWVLLDGDVPFLHVDDSPLVYRGRNYELFGALAGVRGATHRQLPVRGLPVDVSPIVAACTTVEDHYRGHGFASILELRQLFGREFSDFVFEAVVECMDQYTKDGAEVRAVFWFDG